MLSKATALGGHLRLARHAAGGHRFEATQALRQVLNAAVAWEVIDANPARQGVPLLERDQLGRPEPSGDRNTTIGPVTASSCEAGR